MRSAAALFTFAVLALVTTASPCMSAPASASLAWQPLPFLPDPIGFAGSFAGSSRGTLLVAGGANFPGKPPWEGGTKVWHDRVFVLPRDATSWREGGRLPEPNGYGASLSLDQGVLLIGGGDATRNFRSVWCASWDGTTVHFARWPDLPAPLAMACAARVGDLIFVAGGLDRPDATQAQKAFYVLDVTRPDTGWWVIDYLPGPERFLATAGSDGRSFYVFGGARLVPDASGKPQREWLRDAWRYTPRQGWQRLADLPRAAVAAPSPAAWSEGRLLVPGGDDGTQVNTPPGEHRGFPRDVLAYDPVENRWTSAGEVPFSLVTTSAIIADGRLVVPGGEKSPGIRSTEVWVAPLP